MKILIAYDGSECSDAGIDGLTRAGLPSQDAEALVVSVAEVWLPPPPRDEVIDDTFPFQIPAGVKLARERAARIIGQAQGLAERGRRQVQRIFPGWVISHEAVSGSPAFELLNRAREWGPDLIITGSHGHTALGRFVLGSVSQKVLTEAHTSVRVARRATGAGASAERIVVGVDGSIGSDAAVRTVAARDWTPGSEVRVVVVEDLLGAYPVSLLIPPAGESVDEVNQAEHTQAEEIAAKAVKELSDGLDDRRMTVSSVIETGDPKQVLVRHAEEFGADCIFTGATGTSSRIERFVLGSVSAAVAARAHCSVEVVRSATD
ncbi:MAG TPA: universal stress protein [Pyrinomonadaceae bacterium]